LRLALLDFARGTRMPWEIIKAFSGVLKLLPRDDGDCLSSVTWVRLCSDQDGA